MPVILIIGGDIAFSGKRDQYLLFEEFIDNMREELGKRGLILHTIAPAPGNHDCDFEAQSSSVRSALQRAVSSGQEFDPEIARELAVVNLQYEEFVARVSSNSTRLSQIQMRYSVELDKFDRITIDSLNSAWASRLDEIPGALRLPVEALHSPPRDGVAIAVMHHPPNWFEPWNQRALLRWLDENYDIALLGHEHQRELVERQRRDVNARLLILFGHVFNGEPRTASGFSLFRISKEEIETVDFSWNGRAYSKNSTSPRFPIRNSARLAGRPRISGKFSDFLDEPGIALRHPRVSRPLKLDDLYVTPDLRVSTYTGGNASVEEILPSKRIFDRLLQSKLALVSGVEQSGKTSLEKNAFRESVRLGDYPVYLDASKLTSSNQGEITAWINTAYADQYPDDCKEDVEQALPERKLVLIDNVHQVPAGHNGLARVLARLQRHHGRIVAFSGGYSAIGKIVEELASGAENVWRDAELFEIPTTNHRARTNLIRRWVQLGGAGAIGDLEIEAECRQLKRFVDEVFGKNVVPRFPVYILLVLQQLEIAADAKSIVANGSHGYLFEELITRTIDERVRGFKIEIVIAVLTAFAGRLGAHGADALDHSEFQEFFEKFTTERRIAISFTDFRKEIVSAQILSTADNEVRFMHNYYFYYFFARHVAALPPLTRSIELKSLTKFIHTERSANVLTFLAHLGRDTEVVSEVAGYADDLFSDLDLANVSDGSALLSRFRTVEERSVLIDGRPSDVSEHHAESADRLEGRGHAHKIGDGLEGDPGGLNAAFKTIQILGQVLRSRAGNLPGESKHAAAAASARLARRLMRLVFALVEVHGADIARQLSGALEQGMQLTPEEARKLANRLLAWLVSQMTVASVSRVSTAVGSNELRPLISDLKELHNDSTDSLFWLGAAILSDRQFPGGAVERFLKTLRDSDVLPKIVVRELVKRRFYLSPPDNSTKRKFCALLGLEIMNLPPKIVNTSN